MIAGVNDRFTQTWAGTPGSATQWAGQPGVGPIYYVPAVPRQLLVGPELPFIPPSPWYITERPAFVPGKGPLYAPSNGPNVVP